MARIAGIGREDYEYIKNKLEADTESVADLLGTIQRRYMPDYAYDGTDDDLDLYTLHMAMNSAIRIVRDKKNPKKTRQSEFLKMYPNATPFHIDPCNVDTDMAIDSKCRRKPCIECREEYWLAEIE